MPKSPPVEGAGAAAVGATGERKQIIIISSRRMGRKRAVVSLDLARLKS